DSVNGLVAGQSWSAPSDGRVKAPAGTTPRAAVNSAARTATRFMWSSPPPSISAPIVAPVSRPAPCHVWTKRLRGFGPYDRSHAAVAHLHDLVDLEGEVGPETVVVAAQVERREALDP